MSAFNIVAITVFATALVVGPISSHISYSGGKIKGCKQTTIAFSEMLTGSAPPDTPEMDAKLNEFCTITTKE